MSEHPRDRFDLIPDAAAEAAFVDAQQRGRLHHAWLLCGVEGSGKATFAYRAARRLLGAAPNPSRGPLGADSYDPVSRQIAAQSHPDLLVLERLVEGGKTKKSISVDQARDLPEFFSKSPSQAHYRVAIIDAADDLNLNAANALLKVLEEPPERGVLFLVTHAPGRLLATIRSRCRRLAFPVWPQHALEEMVRNRTGVSSAEASRIAGMAGGSPGQALALASGATLEADQIAQDWVNAEHVDRAEALAIADKFRGAEGQERFETLMERLIAAVKVRALEEGASGAKWADLWTRLSDLPDRTAAINLDRADVLAGALADLQRTKAARG
ncbi:DNA polymerase III subunit delta' [Brevundimonas sp. M20]|uniref:DNA polymerase III subunit delta' n=1 Tax=Brevundimonas sp. M20 TaxID=2591463 RepID=UPI00114675DC|nr:DNA polymerase III subunit delta' [Brevundimonas sp. M20]QDH73565.1 DNA polymerase III subunit delta' [Brevundimonas sp. M20]